MAKQYPVVIPTKPQPKVFSDKELEEFNVKYIEPYRHEVYLEYFNETVRIPDWPEVYFQAGVKSKDGRVRVGLFEDFEEKYRQWQAMMDRKDFWQNKRLENLEAVNQDKINLEQAYKDF